MPNLPDSARATVARHGMLPPDAVVLVMVSGGADSVALLRLLAAREVGPVADLRALHVNHGLRGADADGDEVFVVALCERLGVPCEVVRCDVAALAAGEGLNLEDAGRRVRYRFADTALDARCAELGVGPDRGRIAVAHTADDRLETFLARLVSGAGPGGLASIAPVRGRIVRPLLDARRADVVDHLDFLGQEWRTDATNADTTRERAWVRHELLPLVEARNPSFAQTAARTMTLLAEDDALLQEMADAFARDFSEMEQGVLVIDRAAMSTLSRPMARRTIRTAIVRAFPEASRLEYEHCEALASALSADGSARDLPFGLRADAEYGRLRISQRGDVTPLVVPGLLSLPGRLDLGAAGTIEAREGSAGTLMRGPDRVTIDAGRLSWPLAVDAPREGDRIRPFGLEGTRKLSDVLVDAKVPRRLRQAVPVVRSEGRIVWVAGVILAEECRVTAETSLVADLEWQRPGEGTSGVSG